MESRETYSGPGRTVGGQGRLCEVWHQRRCQSCLRAAQKIVSARQRDGQARIVAAGTAGRGDNEIGITSREIDVRDRSKPLCTSR